jgi:hypothetical protein
MVRAIFPDDPNLASVHVTEAFDAEQTATYAGEQLEAETTTAEAEAFVEEAGVKAKAEEAATMADFQA